MSRLVPEINTIYVCRPLGFSKLMSKSFANYAYMQNGILLNSGPRKVHRYAKDYTLDDTDFCFLIITEDDSPESVEDSFANLLARASNKLRAMVAQATLLPISTGSKHGG